MCLRRSAQRSRGKGDPREDVERKGHPEDGGKGQGRVGLRDGQPHGGGNRDVRCACRQGAEERSAAGREPEQDAAAHAQQRREQWHQQAEANQERALAPQFARLARHDQAHLQQEHSQRSLEQVEEQRPDGSQALRAGDPPDRHPAQQQHHTLAEERLVTKPPPVGSGTQPAGENDARHDGRHCHDCEEDRQLGLEVYAPRIEPIHPHRERGNADRTVVGGGGRRVRQAEAAQPPQHGEGKEGLDESQHDHRAKLRHQGQQRLFRQPLAALEPDGQEQHQGKRIVERRRQA